MTLVDGAIMCPFRIISASTIFLSCWRVVTHITWVLSACSLRVINSITIEPLNASLYTRPSQIPVVIFSSVVHEELWSLCFFFRIFFSHIRDILLRCLVWSLITVERSEWARRLRQLSLFYLKMQNHWWCRPYFSYQKMVNLAYWLIWAVV